MPRAPSKSESDLLQSTTDDPLDIAIVGRACRLPGAPSIDELWRLLREGRCSVTSIPADRWGLDRALHPRLAEPGKTYTWAAGVLDDIWGFDAAAFGISPREAEQMDPQQRLLLELVWEALEDAGIRPSSIAGSETGVFVGASAVDHATLRMIDMAAADAYMMTGNTLSIVSNRISYVFDLHGPSFTVDTACSSSLVAVAEAVAALRSGRIDTAIVGGVSLLLAPQSFVGFSQAAMLSRIGLCQAFSANADGYVRAEGGVTVILKTRAAALRDGDAIRGTIVAADVNSDGRTNGISLPSQTYQANLLQRTYLDRGLDPDDLAFVEAHGTGTPVGDPIEAAALGEILGRRRNSPLPIGSLKSNIGHLEAASGLAGLLKATLALDHGVLPRSLHCEDLNPAIDFTGLNLIVAQAPMQLPRRETRRRLAGVNSFGFGGTNAHVVLAEASKPIPPVVDRAPRYLILSAQSRGALAALATKYSTHLDRIDEPAVIAAAAAHRRDRLTHRLIVLMDERTKMKSALERFGTGDTEQAIHGAAVARTASVAFVFSGNGSQFAGMGRAAFATNPAFRARIVTISDAIGKRVDWSIVDALQADDLASQLVRTRVAQPMLFALQSAAYHALSDLGLVPDVVLGHSVGEIAAAEAAGILDLDTALDIVVARSQHQELTFRSGGMAVVVGTQEAVAAIVEDIPGLEIAARNSPRALTVAGDAAALAHLPSVARRHKARVVPLDLAYPFHSAGVDPIQVPLLSDLAGLARSAGHTPFISSVSGDVADGNVLDAHYWWRNVREPVRFADAVERAYRFGARVFVEIGPQAMLLSHVADSLEDRAASIATIAAMNKREAVGDPLAAAVAQSLVRGARVDERKVFGSGPRPGTVVGLPHYPWQRRQYRLPESAESPGLVRPTVWHPLIGARTGPGQLEWRATLDIISHPWIADHRVAGRVILPGTAFVEMALALARDWLGAEQARVENLEITSPLVFSGEASVEIACIVSPVASYLQVLSRPRLSTSPWQTHVTAKIVRDASALPTNTPHKSLPHAIEIVGSQIYTLLEQVGLCYGPAFRKLARATTGGGQIRLDLTDEETESSFGLDPARFDACLHALMLAMPDGNDVIGATAYVPTHFDDIVLFRPGVTFVSAEIDIVRRDARVMIADITVRDRASDAVAEVRGARFQAIRPARQPEHQVVRARYALAAEPTAARRDAPIALAALRGKTLRPRLIAPARDDFVLLDGWASSFALELTRDLAPDGRLDLAAVVEAGAWPQQLEPWLQMLLDALARSGLARREADGYVIENNAVIPKPADLVAAIAREQPALSAEAMAAVAAGLAVAAIRAGGNLDQARASTSRAVETMESASVYTQAAAEMLDERLRTPAWPRDRATRILLIGAGPLLRRALDIVDARQARLSIFEPERRRHERARLAVEGRRNVVLSETIEALPQKAFDLVIIAGALDRCNRVPRFWWAARHAMAPDAIFAAIEPAPSLFRDLVLGLEAHLGDDAARTLSAIRWRATLKAAGLSDVSVDPIATRAGEALMLTGQAASEGRHHAATGTALIVGDAPATGTTAALATLLASAGLHVKISDGDEPLAPVDAGEPLSLIVFVPPGVRKNRNSSMAIQNLCTRLRTVAQTLGQREARLWLVLPRGDEIAAAVVAFSRTLANEYAALDIRRVEFAPRVSPENLGARLRDLVLAETDETDIVIAPDTTHVLRFETETIGTLQEAAPATAAKLAIGEGAGLDRLRWVVSQRRAPAFGEVEVAIEAIGINFRDVMFGLGLLPDDILEHGFAGPALGLECAGRITRIGAGVKGIKPGDRVMAFARDAFATHATTAVALVANMPVSLTSEAAATIPVAFLTAYYGLIEQARLKPREWILIHGGAGGVGLAALQIALWRGARVIATAGTPEKRALLQMLGATHVFDSRSGTFIDAVRQVAGDGVAVALNSLAGEPMERTIGLLRPFGRFVELGKRDYVANTPIGLRPFRRNLSYFGVDLDQLLGAEPALARRLMQNVMRLFANGALTPLPHRVFEAAETREAFRLMQASGHVGKLVLRPPDPARIQVKPERKAWHAAADKLHLVTGGLGGFGFATAEWLVARGARDLMLVSRSGVADSVVSEKIAALTAHGVRVRTQALDVTDGPALGRLFARFGRDLPPLAGIVHAAMVLDDALIPNLTADAFARVLAPKVTGAAHLDRLTRKLPLDYFLLYSSATTLIGNPGQAAYVAANGYLEGLAQRRRRAGLPALAVAWGAIEDVGVVSRAPAVKELLETRAGVVALPARDALDQLGEVLAHTDSKSETAVLTLASMDWATARAHVPVLSAPAYGGLVGGAAKLAEGANFDIAALVAKNTPDEARKLVGGLIVEEIARVLRLPREDVPKATPLAEIGLDSLMAVELALGLENRFTLDRPLAATASGFSVNELADHVIGLTRGGPAATPLQATLARHLDPEIEVIAPAETPAE